MSIISHDDIFEIYPEQLKTHGDKLPAYTYALRFSKMQGFFLEKQSDYIQKEKKIYGNHLAKIEKTLTTFKKSNRSLGIILSGKKGIGKSLFANLLGSQALKENLPVILVEKGYHGIKDFLSSIDQEAIIIFDEFEKNFSDTHAENDSSVERQSSLLGLFDGVSQSKHLYVLTVNNLNRLSEFYLNRPGRFHYHFKFTNPSVSEIEEYLKDNLTNVKESTIVTLCNFSTKVSLNYDCLRAIVTELNNGYNLEETLEDLNISPDESTINYTLTVKDATTDKMLFSTVINPTLATLPHNEHYNKGVDTPLGDRDWVWIDFNTSDVHTNENKTLRIDKLILNFDEDNNYFTSEKFKDTPVYGELTPVLSNKKFII